MVSIKFIQSDGEESVVEGDTGLSVMEVAINNNIAGVTAECGGNATCGTCHAYVADEWKDRLKAPDDMETQMLEFVMEPRETSRLTCQIPVTAEMDGIVFMLPDE